MVLRSEEMAYDKKVAWKGIKNLTQFQRRASRGTSCY